MKIPAEKIAVLLAMILLGGCSPVPIPYLTRVPKGISRIVVCDPCTGLNIPDACVKVTYYPVQQSCVHLEPEVFSYQPVANLSDWPPPPANPKMIGLQKDKDGSFRVRGTIKIASVQPLWMPALPHTLFNDYAISISVSAPNYYPLTFRYFGANVPKEVIKTGEGALVTRSSRGTLRIELRPAPSTKP